VTRAAEWHDSGYRGAGVEIGVLASGFQGYQDLLGSELPASVTAQSFRQDGDITGGGESVGTACAEVIYDMAPDGALYLANYETEAEFADAVDWFIGQGVDIISCPLGWLPVQDTGVIYDAVARACESGVLWVNAAGDTAKRHWQGTFQDNDGDGMLEFGEGEEYNTFTTAEKGAVTLYLSWEDPSQDYDLYLYRRTGNHWKLEASSEGETPSESVELDVKPNKTYGVVIRKKNGDGESGPLKLYCLGYDLEFNEPANSLLIPADMESVLSVGAFRWDTGEIESYSGRGPTDDGRVKPDLLGPDSVTTVTNAGFQGTSAGAAHTAGAAALVKEAHPGWGPDEIKAYLQENAQDNPGEEPADGASLRANDPPNNNAGSGNLDLGAPPDPTAEIPLVSGWNLVSFNVTPASTAIEDVLSSIAGSYDLVYAYDAHDVADPWKKYNTAAPPFLNDLTDLDEQTGFWIRATAEVTLTVAGLLPASTDIQLATGWNLVGYPSQTVLPVAEALQSIDGKYDLVYAYDAHDVADPWKKYNTAAPPFLNDLTTVEPKRGYWIRVTEDCVWQVNGG